MDLRYVCFTGWALKKIIPHLTAASLQCKLIKKKGLGGALCIMQCSNSWLATILNGLLDEVRASPHMDVENSTLQVYLDLTLTSVSFLKSDTEMTNILEPSVQEEDEEMQILAQD